MTDDKFEKLMRAAMRDPRAKEVLRRAAERVAIEAGMPDVLKRLEENRAKRQ